MRKGKGILAMVVTAAMLACCGCLGQQGLQDGVNSGIKDAVATLITAIVDGMFN